MVNFTQMNVKIEPEFVEEIERLADTHGWTKAGAIRVAIRTLAEVMGKHEDAPRDADDDLRDLYLWVAAEIPGQLVEVARSVELGRVGDQPVIRVAGWRLWEDELTGDLVAREEGGEQRFGRVVDGRIEAMVSPAVANLN